MKWLRKSAAIKVEERERLIAKLRQPYRFFAWYPVRLNAKNQDGMLEYVWLETVWKKRLFYDSGERMWNEYHLRHPESITK